MAAQALGKNARRPAINRHCPICGWELTRGGSSYRRKSDNAIVNRMRCNACGTNFSDAPAGHGGRPRSSTVVFSEAQQAMTMDE